MQYVNKTVEVVLTICYELNILILFFQTRCLRSLHVLSNVKILVNLSEDQQIFLQ